MFDNKTISIKLHKRFLEKINMILGIDGGRSFNNLEHFLRQAILEKIDLEMDKLPKPKGVSDEWVESKQNYPKREFFNENSMGNEERGNFISNGTKRGVEYGNYR